LKPGHWPEFIVLSGTVSEGSEIAYRSSLRPYVIPSLGRKRLVKLTPGDVTTMMRAMEARGLSSATRNAAKKVFRRALARAKQQELTHRNVANIADGARLNRTEWCGFTPQQAKTVLAAMAG
jgi:hypothetical protein